MKYPHLSKEGFGEGLTPLPQPSGPGGPKTLKADNTFLKTVYKTKDVQQVANYPGSTGYLS